MSVRLIVKLLVVALSAAVPLCASAAQTDVALSAYGALNTTTNTSNGLTQTPADSIGGMIELRHISSPWFGFEATYSLNRANQSYSDPIACPGANCPLSPYATSVSANAHEITGDWIFSLKTKRFRPFAVLGAGVILDVPTKGTVYSYSLAANPAFQSTPAPISSSTKPVLVLGFGMDWDLFPHLGLRLQYRDNLYTAPALTTAIGSTNALSQTQEPLFGAYYRF
uniref:Outer membrane protein beta-barrel domain-containing protein n=1 Tax=mine drainage metagenome TaxID=410659 RepID=E6QHL2_9ZZZZ